VGAGFDEVSILIQGPERVPKDVRWVIFLLDFDQAVPVIAEAGLGTFGGFEPAEETW